MRSEGAHGEELRDGGRASELDTTMPRVVSVLRDAPALLPCLLCRCRCEPADLRDSIGTLRLGVPQVDELAARGTEGELRKLRALGRSLMMKIM